MQVSAAWQLCGQSQYVPGSFFRRSSSFPNLHFIPDACRKVVAKTLQSYGPPNYATHKTPEVKAWLKRHPRFKLHFTPTSASWLNLVERFFAEITANAIRRGSFTSVTQLETAIEDYLMRRNASPKPFVWTATARSILDKERRALQKLNAVAEGYRASDSEH